MSAHGNVNFSAIISQGAPASKKAPAKPMEFGKLSMQMQTLPEQQHWKVDGQELHYQLEPAIDPKSARVIDHVIHLTSNDPANKVHVTIIDPTTNKTVFYAQGCSFTGNQDTEAFNMDVDETDTEGGHQ